MARQEITDYDILNALGSGSYSTVYRARHKRTREVVAVKTVAMSSLSKSSTDNLLREIRMLKTLKHKYIVEMFDFMWDDKNIYILMELCRAGDLSAYIKRHRRLPESTCKFFLRQLAVALRYMRDHHVSHFDLKPQNLLLTATPLTLKVADFGFAQHLNPTEVNTALKGSPLYMAPEILLHRRYDPSADLWSIGCILYECLCGAAPYRSRSLGELVEKVRSRQRIEMPDSASASADCADLLRRLLVHEPGERITFEAFFAHRFLDVAHEPTDANLRHAIRLVTEAVRLDTSGDRAAAYERYCDGLQYFGPLIAAETDARKRAQLRHNADAYLRRAEELRFGAASGPTAAAAQLPAAAAQLPAAAAQLPDRTGGAASALRPSERYGRLHAASASSPGVRDGLEIGRQAELYMFERNYAAAIESYRSALVVLVPALAAEPRGERRELLHRQIGDWMDEAEQVKVLLAAREQLRTADELGGIEIGTEAAAAAAEPASGATDDETRAGVLAYAKSCCLQ